MRNTHFGDGGFSGGFHHSKFKPVNTTAQLVAAVTSGAVFEQVSIDSDRNQASRKRATKAKTGGR